MWSKPKSQQEDAGLKRLEMTVTDLSLLVIGLTWMGEAAGWVRGSWCAGGVCVMCVCVCVRVCVCACVRACVRACVCDEKRASVGLYKRAGSHVIERHK